MTDQQNRIEFLDTNFRDYAWKYFALHADQRLKAFQFFITLSTAITGALIFMVRLGDPNKWVSILGLLLVILAFVFWKLEQRTKDLIKNGENALKYLDSLHSLENVDEQPHPLRLFTRDDHLTSHSKKFPIKDGSFSYSNCFNSMFLVVGSGGAGFFIWALFSL